MKTLKFDEQDAERLYVLLSKIIDQSEDTPYASILHDRDASIHLHLYVDDVRVLKDCADQLK